MPGMKVTDAVELQIRTFLKQKAGTLFGAKYVFDNPVYFASPQDFAAKVKDTYTSTYKVKYIMMSFGIRQNSFTKGCDENPDAFLTYKFQLFRQSTEIRDDVESSHNLIVKDQTFLQNTFLVDRDIVLNKIVHQALVQQEDLVLVRPSDYVLGITGDRINFRLIVEVN